MATMTLTPASYGAPTYEAPVLRLTSRGRLVVGALAVAMVLLCAFGLAGRVAAGTTSQAPALTKVVVQPGESLWGFAQKAMPGTDPREAVMRIRELNALSTSVIQPGQLLVVPAH
jgi:LysM repeat protein